MAIMCVNDSMASGVGAYAGLVRENAGKATAGNEAAGKETTRKQEIKPEKETAHVKKMGDSFAKGLIAGGYRVLAQGWTIDKDGEINHWSITATEASKEKSFLQKMRERSEEIRHKQLKRAIEAEKRELAALKRRKKSLQQNGINLKV